jgi:hypothetical protein
MKTKSRFYFSLLLIASLLVPTWIVSAAPASDVSHFRLPADAGWVDSGFTVQAGEQITITAYGQAITAPIKVFSAGAVNGPDGLRTRHYSSLSIPILFDHVPPSLGDS